MTSGNANVSTLSMLIDEYMKRKAKNAMLFGSGEMSRSEFTASEKDLDARIAQCRKTIARVEERKQEKRHEFDVW